MRRNYVRLVAGVLTGALTIGSVTVSATTPGAGVTGYTTNIITSTTLPAAGVSAALSDSMLNGDKAAADKTTVTENDAQVVKSEYADIGIAKVNDCVYVRKEANADSDYVGKLYTNNAATIEETLDGWYKIKSGNVEGYVSADYVVVGDEEAIANASSRIATIKTETLKVRTEAKDDAKVITLVAEDEEYKVFKEEADGWVGIKVNDEKGYVSADYVDVSTKYTYGETKEEEQNRIEEEEAERERERMEAEEAAQAASSSSNSSSSSKSSSSKKSSSSSSKKNYSKPSGSKTGQAVANYACQFVGNPYKYGGTSLTNGADCSGFVMSVYKAFGVSLPHSSSAMRSCGYGVSVNEMAPGDIVCYSGHVGIYVGGGQIVNASTRKTGIKYSNVHYKNIICVRRIF